MENSNKGFVYILTNPSFKGDIVKIGMTSKTVEERIASLDTTGVVTPFECYASLETDKYCEVEKLMHSAFEDYRIRSNREFFKIVPERALAVLKKVANICDGTIHIGNDISSKTTCVKDPHIKISHDSQNPALEKLKDCTVKVFSEICPGRKINLRYHSSYNCLQVCMQEWLKAVHFEWVPMNDEKLNDTNYTLEVHFENMNIKAKIASLLSDHNIKEEYDAVGLRKPIGRTYYSKTLSTVRSIAEMTYDELYSFLKEMYTDVPSLIKFIESNHIYEN